MQEPTIDSWNINEDLGIDDITNYLRDNAIDTKKPSNWSPAQSKTAMDITFSETMYKPQNTPSCVH